MLVQVALQPSFAVLLLSSQVSFGCKMPSPHLKQALPDVGHFQPVSKSQIEEQPSRLEELPSSQSSVLSCTPLPHSSQACPGTGQLKPVATAVQVALQPSPAVVLP